MRWLLLVLVLALVGGVTGWWFVRGSPTSPGHVLSVVTSPAGATLTIAGKVVGQTPYFADNPASGPVEYSLTLPGYQPSKGVFEGNQDVRLEVRLTRKKVKRVITVDAGVIELELDEPLDDTPLHSRGPLRPKEPEEFVDEDLAKEPTK